MPALRVRRSRILDSARAATRKVRRKIASITIIAVRDRFMSKLHRDYLGIRGTTDVLTFDLSESSRAPLEAEIYICVDQARRQSREYRVSLSEEMSRLAAHGVLHLAGYDDHYESCRRVMQQLEDECLSEALTSPGKGGGPARQQPGKMRGHRRVNAKASR